MTFSSTLARASDSFIPATRISLSRFRKSFIFSVARARTLRPRLSPVRAVAPNRASVIIRRYRGLKAPDDTISSVAR